VFSVSNAGATFSQEQLNELNRMVVRKFAQLFWASRRRSWLKSSRNRRELKSPKAFSLAPSTICLCTVDLRSLWFWRRKATSRPYSFDLGHLASFQLANIQAAFDDHERSHISSVAAVNETGRRLSFIVKAQLCVLQTNQRRDEAK